MNVNGLRRASSPENQKAQAIIDTLAVDNLDSLAKEFADEESTKAICEEFGGGQQFLQAIFGVGAAHLPEGTEKLAELIIENEGNFIFSGAAPVQTFGLRRKLATLAL